MSLMVLTIAGCRRRRVDPWLRTTARVRVFGDAIVEADDPVVQRQVTRVAHHAEQLAAFVRAAIVHREHAVIGGTEIAMSSPRAWTTREPRRGMSSDGSDAIEVNGGGSALDLGRAVSPRHGRA